MKPSQLLLLSSALGASAQSRPPVLDPLAFPQGNDGTQAQLSPFAGTTSAPTGTTTVTVDVYADCTDTATWMGGVDTVTATITETTCPLCTDMPTKSHTTVYATELLELCSTGLRGKTWTVTESCPTTCDRGGMAPDYMPQGFTTTVTVCTVCGHKPTPVTLTVPCTETPAPGAAGMPAPAAATPTAAAVPSMDNAAMPSAASTPAAMATPPVCAGNGTCPSVPSNSTMPTAGAPKADSFPGAASREAVGKTVTLFAVGMGLLISHYFL